MNGVYVRLQSDLLTIKPRVMNKISLTQITPSILAALLVLAEQLKEYDADRFSLLLAWYALVRVMTKHFC